MRMQEESITDNVDLQRLTKERKTTETQIMNIMTAISEFMGHSLGAIGNAYTSLSEEYLINESKKLDNWE